MALSMWAVAHARIVRRRCDDAVRSGRAGRGASGVRVSDHGAVADDARAVRLTSDEVALVLRRAVEIEAASSRVPDTTATYDTAAVEAAADEVGVSPAAVRQAVAELQVGALSPEPARPRRRAAPTHLVIEQRFVSTTPWTALTVAERLLRAQLFELRRRTDERAVFRPRTDLLAVVRRKVRWGGELRFEGVSAMTVVATAIERDTLVRVEAELATTRSHVVTGAAGAGVGVALATGLGGALLAEPLLLVSALPAGTVVAAGGMRVAGRRWQQQRDDIAESLADLVDRF